eukprot:7197-Heterococcus_DN1.PRE.2
MHRYKQVSMPDLLEHATLQSLAALLERRSCNSPTAIHTTDGTTNTSSSSSGALTATEKALAAVWASVLRMDAASAAAVIKRDSDFFDLGGHSLLLVKVAAGVETDMGVSLGDVLERPTLQALAAHIDALNGTAATTATTDSTAPASPPLHDPLTTGSANGHANGHSDGHGNGRSNASKSSNSSASADVIDLPAEAAKLDPSVYPAPTRKAGYSRFR